MANISIPRDTTPANATADSENAMRTLVCLRSHLRGRALLLTQCQHDADDLVQRVVERALSHPDVFRPGYNYWGWLSRVMRNMFLDDYRMRRVRKVASIDVEQIVRADVDAQPSPCDLLTADDLLEGIAKLPEPQRAVVRLVYLSGYSYREVSNRLGIGCNTLGTRLLRARQRLKTILEDTYR